jgi:ketosteroid isomerase-like protein
METTMTLESQANNKQEASDVEALSAASEAFYAAFSASDLGAMESIWAHEPYVCFVGPRSTEISRGWDEVKKVFAQTFESFPHLTIGLGPDPILQSRGRIGWVVGIENSQIPGPSGDVVILKTFATNMFENVGGRWLLVLHQASLPAGSSLPGSG